MRLEGKVAIVTGAASGIGRAIAERFAREGARLALTDIDSAGLEAAVVAVTEIGADVLSKQVDVSESDQVRELVATTVRRWGRLDILSHNAGIDQPVGPALELDEATWWRVLRINAAGTLWCDTHAARAMLAGDGGSIVNMTSDLSYVVVPGLAAYCASKGAALQLTRTLAAEWAPRVRVNALCPTMVDTPMGRRSVSSRPDPEAYLRQIASEIPMGRIAHVDDLTGAAVFLASDEAAYITGIALPIDGGRTVV